MRKNSPNRAVRVKIADNLHCVGDQGLLRIALENLINNAWKYTGRTDDPSIHFDAAPHDGETVFRIRDNGVGFDMNNADKLFGTFQRLHHNDDFEGTGIGLATVSRIIHRHGGEIWAEAEPGKGATFFFTVKASSPITKSAITAQRLAFPAKREPQEIAKAHEQYQATHIP